jgi:hypothetical protein
MAEQGERTFHSPATGVLRGCQTECAALAEVVLAVRQGASRTLVLRGDAGIGKTALLEYAVASATDLRVLRAAGVESEMELAFAALHQLCGPMLDALGQLPGPQREALSIVFGRSAGPRPDPFMVGLAVLSLMSECAEERPLLCVVDDAQWLDRATAQTLTLVARRLRAEGSGCCSVRARPARSFVACRTWTSRGWTLPMRARFWAPSWGSCSTSGCATASWPRRGETPSLCSSWPAG